MHLDTDETIGESKRKRKKKEKENMNIKNQYRLETILSLYDFSIFLTESP